MAGRAGRAGRHGKKTATPKHTSDVYGVAGVARRG